MINKKTKIYHLILYGILFLATFLTTTLAGVQWLNQDPLELSNFSSGIQYSSFILIFLLSHEFGHYFAAKFHNVETTLPYFIPAPPFLINPFGTMGALIRMKSTPRTTSALFDIGIAGPIAGFCVSIIFLVLGFFTLPQKDYIFTIHPEYQALNIIPSNGLYFGDSLLFTIFEKIIPKSVFFPPMNEIYHYPYLCVGWFGLFVTGLNLMPVGQLDGGHIVYAMFGNKIHRIVARIFFFSLILAGLISVIHAIISQIYPASIGWLVWGIMLYFIVKLDHPQTAIVEHLSTRRKLLGLFSLVIFILSFSPIPFIDIP
ncbi:MAG: site-2 protease family protein [Ignavibacteriales bacterium]|nr:site-2 protease family protein [Ignavibacteriales bacterium]